MGQSPVAVWIETNNYNFLRSPVINCEEVSLLYLAMRETPCLIFLTQTAA